MRRSGMLSALVLLLGLGLVVGPGSRTAQALSSANVALIVSITGVQVGNPMTTESCGMDGTSQVIPVTIQADFFPARPDVDVVGPYATVTWDGGFGSFDDHYPDDSKHQVFHVLVRPSDNDWHGQGTYSFRATVQDVGIGMGSDSVVVDADLSEMSPLAWPREVKCPMGAKPVDPSSYLKSVGLAAGKIVCEFCTSALELLDQVNGYGEMSGNLLRRGVLEDPPDPAFRTIPTPATPPVLPVPDGLTSEQSTAALALEATYASYVADLRGLVDAGNRAWGAANAGSRTWYLAQRQALARFASAAAADARSLATRHAALAATFTGASALPTHTVTRADVDGVLGELSRTHLPPAGERAVLTALGATEADQREIALMLQQGYPERVLGKVTGAQLFTTTPDLAAISSGLLSLSQWARATKDVAPPVVTGLSTHRAPSGGARWIAVTGTNLASVTGLSFGASTPTTGQGRDLSCSETRCDAVVPAGHGTVHVSAFGPGGPSARTDADLLTYVTPVAPQVTRVFPSSGPLLGGTQVSIWGTGLSDSLVRFGPQLALDWTCSDTRCTARAPQSEHDGRVDVRVSTDAGTSPAVADDGFTYLAGEPPPPPAPTVSGLSATHGSRSGGDRVTVTGTGFTGATDVLFGTSAGTDVEVVDATHLQVTTPDHAPGQVHVSVSGPGGSSAAVAADRFTFDSLVPSITALSAASGPSTGGNTLTVTGKALNQGMVVLDDGAPAEGTCTATACVVTMPPHAEDDVDVTVETASGVSVISTATRYHYALASAPLVRSLTPDTGSTAGGDTLAVTGLRLDGGQVTVGGADADPVSGLGCEPTLCVVTVPPGSAGDRSVVVTRVDGTRSAASAAATYSYVRPGAPRVTSVSPATGWVHGLDTVNVYGDNLLGGTVRFGGAEAHGWTGVDCTQSVCTVAPAWRDTTGSVDVTVRTPGGTSPVTAAGRFTYVRPTVTAVTPSKGWTIGGTTVTVTGSHLRGADLSFDGVPGTQVACEETSCTAVAPAGAAGPVHVVATANDGMVESVPSSADVFTYQQLPVPTVSSVSPNRGSDAGGDTIVVTGTDLDAGIVRIDGDQLQGTCLPTRCEVVTLWHADGAAPLTVTTDGGTSAPRTYTFATPAVPTVTGVTPSGGRAGGGDVVTVTGSDLTNGSVTFGGTDGLVAGCTFTSCRVTVPAHAPGAVHVQVTTPAGTSATSTADRFTYATPPTPVVTALSPRSGPRSGGSAVRLTGTDLDGATVDFGGVPAAAQQCTRTWCEATAPPGTPSTVHVRATTYGGTSAATAADTFTWSPVQVDRVPIEGLSDGAAAGGGHLVAAPDGSVDFVMPQQDAVGHVTAGGTTTSYAVPDASSLPVSVTRTADGTVWYTEQTPNVVVEHRTDGTEVRHDLPGQHEDVRDLVAGPDGRVWFALAASDAIGAIDPATGRVEVHALPTVAAFPVNLTVGPDDRIWFTEGHAGRVGAITTDGEVSEYALPSGNSSPWDITTGPDGRLWFTESGGHALGAVTTGGAVTEYPVAGLGGSPYALTSGADGRVWFTRAAMEQVSAMDPATGTVTDHPLPPDPGGVVAHGDEPRYLTTATDGSIWATELNGNDLVHVTGTTTGVTPAVTALSPAWAAPGATVTVTGAHLQGATAVSFGGTPATGLQQVDAAHVRVVVPAGSGTPTVTVTTPAGTTAAAPAAVFHYGTRPPETPVVETLSPPSGPGGTVVELTGRHLTGATVRVGGVAATATTCLATRCTATVPAGSGTDPVTVTTPGGQATASQRFTYDTSPPARPAVSRISPTSGTTTGGTKVTVTGTGLAGGRVQIGLRQVDATCSATTCTFTTPVSGTGPVHVRVTGDGGTSLRSSADVFTFAAPVTPVTLALTSAPSVVTAGGTGTVKGTLTTTSGARPVAGTRVWLQTRTPGTSTWKDTVSALTTSTGTVALALKPVRTLEVQLRTGAVDGHTAATSGRRTVGCRAVVTATFSATTITKGSSSRLSGKVTPSYAGHQVFLQRRTSSGWTTVTSRTLSSTSGYTFTIKPTTRGTFTYRVRLPKDTRFWQSLSRERSLKVT